MESCALSAGSGAEDRPSGGGAVVPSSGTVTEEGGFVRRTSVSSTGLVGVASEGGPVFGAALDDPSPAEEDGGAVFVLSENDPAAQLIADRSRNRPRRR